MQKTHLFMMAIWGIATAVLANNALIYKSAQHLYGAEPSPETYGLTIDSDNQYNGIKSYGVAIDHSYADIVANTNSAAFVAWLQSRPENVIASAKASFESDLTNAIYQAFSQMPPYSDNVVDNHKTMLRTQMNTYRADVEAATTLEAMRDAQKELNLRQKIINLIREIESLDKSWSLGDVQ